MSSGFISESEILEARRRRQEEWEKVRTEDQPKENMIRGLDDDEVGFLDLVERTKAKAAQQISLEEQKEMQEFRERVSNLAESEELIRLRAQLAPTRTPATTQPAKNKLQGVVVRKRKASEMEGDKADKVEPEKTSSPPKNGIINNSVQQNGTSETPTMATTTGDTGALRCVAILPGLGHYDTDTSSDTDDSSDFETCEKSGVKRDLLGRRPESQEKKDESKS
ncbi:Protein FAM192A [Papilio machaon]|uniref:Protein FAM192A n=1 Tax=Papilio machaon TaxID=76193 RepID=A0A0N1PJ77_PAPMA|nr:Protein FAM192A [Papilio machaon]